VSDFSEEEQLARLASWWKRNGTALLIGLVVAAAGVAGWEWYKTHTASRVVAASDQYETFLAASGDERKQLAEEIVAGGDATAYPALVLMRRAQEAVTANDLASAEQDLARAVETASGAILADLARLRLARVQHALDKDDDALATLAQIRSAGYVPLAQEQKGDIHVARNERKLAHEAYEAALAAVKIEDQRTLLEMKVADTADASGS
jgi:predicted negative regulator of RcsB-dependent stress response